jgi:hypothetical protein
MATASEDMAVGKFKLVSGEHFDDFLKALGKFAILFNSF